MILIKTTSATFSVSLKRFDCVFFTGEIWNAADNVFQVQNI